MFVTQGPLHPESRLFTGRGAELKRMETWLANAHCVGAVLGAGQTGKTSLLLKLRHTLRSKGAFVFVDLEAVANADLTECLTFIAREMVHQLAGEVGGLTAAAMQDRSDFLGFLEAFAQAARSVRIVVLLDEIGALKPETALRLSSVIRAVFTTRHVKPGFARYVFVLAGATDMLELTTGRNSPLKNVADSLYLGDLSPAETQQLVAEVFGEALTPERHEVVRTLHDWTGGHPYWTQLLGEALGREEVAVTPEGVQAAVEQLVHTEDRNLPHVFKALENDGSLSQLVEALLARTPVSFSRAHRGIAKLELIGLLKNDRGRCIIRNRIYRAALEQHPVRRPRAPGRDLHQLTKRLLKCGDAETLLETATADVQAALQVLSAASFLKPAGENAFSLVASVGIGEGETLRFDSASRLAHLAGGVIEPAGAGLRESEIALLDRLGIGLIVPVAVKDDTVAFFWLGRKLSGDEYDEEDREFLTALAEHTASGLDRLQLRTLERDAQKAWQIQQRLLPRELPQVEGLKIAASCRPARLVAGDYYDVVKLDDHRLAICIGDVIGKGLPAALLMANLQAAVRRAAPGGMSPCALCADVNRLIADNLGLGQFITFFYAIIDVAARRCTYTTAGHNPPILIRRDATIERLAQGGPPLGLSPEWNHDEQQLPFEPGDRLLLFTDGVTELRNSNGDEFGDERLIAIARDHMDAAALHQAVAGAVVTFSGGVIQDDLTILAVAMTSACDPSVEPQPADGRTGDRP